MAKATKNARGKQATRVRRRDRKQIERGQAHINSTFNNTMVMLTDMNGNAISWSSAGQLGFKGSRKSTPFAAQQAAEEAAKKAMEHGLKTVEVYVNVADEEILAIPKSVAFRLLDLSISILCGFISRWIIPFL